ncbi:hypothetical protein R6Q59_009848 [Mikania micrantha]
MATKKKLSILLDVKSKTTVTDVEIPPSYDEATLPEITEPHLPSPSNISAHLKLLFAFSKLKENVFNNSTLFGFDDRWIPTEGPRCTENTIKACQALREKRWDVYVRRAVMRFESWWEQMRDQQNDQKVTVKDIYLNRPSMVHIEDDKRPQPWTVDKLPPLDVLMVWHSFLLSPRRYLEDCLLQGMMQLWHTKFPWDAIDTCIDFETGRYDPGDVARSNFQQSVRPWSNEADDCRLLMGCVKCSAILEVECTEAAEKVKAYKDVWIANNSAGIPPDLSVAWKGWADQSFLVSCSQCKTQITRDVLCAYKFIKDLGDYRKKSPVTADLLTKVAKDTSQESQLHIDPWSLSNLQPACGTILDSRTGLQTCSTTKTSTLILNASSTFPIALMDTLIHVDNEGKDLAPTAIGCSMHSIRKVIEKALNCESQMLYATSGKQRRASRDQRVAVRRMMSYYNDNPSIFSLDLASAVVRQGNFVQKMQFIDWLHSPTLSTTATRVILKYQRFYEMMKAKPGEMMVPTLDIDLAWHTNQLTPSEYWKYTTAKTGRFVDHDDKISEHKLSDAFAKTSATYQALFNEPYSECTCWYCEAIHASVAKYPDRRLFRNGVNGYRRPEHACDDHTTAHISTHNVIKMSLPHARYTEQFRKHLKWLDKAYQKACARAKKEGRPIPRRRHPQAADAYYYAGEYGMASGKVMAGAAIGVGVVGVGALAIAYSDEGGLSFEGQPEEEQWRSGGGCVAGACGGGVAWGGDETDNAGVTGACGGDGGPCASWDAAAAADDGGAGCSGGCGGCGGCG